MAPHSCSGHPYKVGTHPGLCWPGTSSVTQDSSGHLDSTLLRPCPMASPDKLINVPPVRPLSPSTPLQCVTTQGPGAEKGSLSFCFWLWTWGCGREAGREPLVAGLPCPALLGAHVSETGRRSCGGCAAASSACSWTGRLCHPPPPPGPSCCGHHCSPWCSPWAWRERAVSGAKDTNEVTS